MSPRKVDTATRQANALYGTRAALCMGFGPNGAACGAMAFTIAAPAGIPMNSLVTLVQDSIPMEAIEARICVRIDGCNANTEELAFEYKGHEAIRGDSKLFSNLDDD